MKTAETAHDNTDSNNDNNFIQKTPANQYQIYRENNHIR